MAIFFRGNVTGNEPPSMVCKITGNIKRDVVWIWRLVAFGFGYGNWDEFMSRHEAAFFQDVGAMMKDTEYGIPKTYFIGKLVFKSLKKPYLVTTLKILMVTSINYRQNIFCRA